MTSRQNPLLKIWRRHPGFLHHESDITQGPPLEKILAELFSVGEFYFYTINIADGTLKHQHDGLIKMHGLKRQPRYLVDIMELMHPDDLTFVQEAEQMTVEKIAEIGFRHFMQLKSSYCFRMRMASGAYEMIHHQSLPTLKSQDGAVLEAVNIHTNINHLMPKNSYIVTVSGMNGRNDFHKMQWPEKVLRSLGQPSFSRREAEIVDLLAKGYNTVAIAKKLHLSPHTVRTHRRNMMSKMRCCSSTQLVMKAFEQGFL